MPFRLAALGQNAICQAIATLLNGGRVLVYTGTQPANPQTTATGTLLTTINLNSPAFTTPTSGSMTLITTPLVTGIVSVNGTAGWCRFVNSVGAVVCDGAVGSDVVFDNPNFVAGGNATLTAVTFAEPM